MIRNRAQSIRLSIASESYRSGERAGKSTDIGPLSPQVRKVLTLLLKAHRYALDACCDDWEFAISLSNLLSDGLTLNDCLWLVRKGYVKVGCEKIPSCSGRREIVPCPTGELANDECGNHACLALTAHGAALARRLAGHSRVVEGEQESCVDGTSSDAPRGHRPRWDAERRELTVDGQVVKHYKCPAPNQEVVLATFEEEGWPHHIYDPLRHRARNEQTPKRRLNDTVKGLNRRQLVPCIHFFADGKGEGICWEWVPEDP
jgi:hypothetical protein